MSTSNQIDAGKATAKDGGQVFPALLPSLQYSEDAPPKLLGYYTAGGLTKREYIAAAALQGILADDSSADYGYAAKQAVDHADALLRTLATPAPSPKADDVNAAPAKADPYTLHENIAAISADFHSHDKVAQYIEGDGESFSERMRLIVTAAEELTRHEPDDYHAAGLDWMYVTPAIADLLIGGHSPAEAVKTSLGAAYKD
jgi:hypothetical protein